MNPSVPTSPSINQYPFSPRENSPRRQPLRRGSTSSTASSNAAASVETYPNAISTLLQPPIIRTGVRPSDAGFKPPTQKDIPPVTLTNIPHVEAKGFHPYLSQVGSLYEAFQRAKNETNGDDTALFHRDNKEEAQDWEVILSKSLHRPPQSRSMSISATSQTSPVSERRPSVYRQSSAQRRQIATPLSTIPAVYSEEDFRLENPRTFDVVSECSEIIRDPTAAPTGKKSLTSNAILQEKLSWYMDTVEIHLVSSISSASKSFFSALGSLKELHREAEESVTKIQKLRRDLARLNKEMASDGLRIVKLKQRRNNVRRLAEAILQMEDIVNAVTRCEHMIEAGQAEAALDCLDNVEQLIAGKETQNLYRERREQRYQPVDLRRLQSLDTISGDLQSLRSRAGRGTESRFHKCLLEDMRHHVQSTDPKDTLQRWGLAFNRPKPGQKRAPSSFPSYMNMPLTFRSELEHAMQGLARARFTTPAVTTFRLQVLREMKSMIRRQLPSSDDDDDVTIMSASTHGGRKLNQQQKSLILARNIRALDAEDWYDMLMKVYTSVSESLRRLSVQVKVLLDVTSTMDQSPSVKSPIVESPNPQSPSTGRVRAQSIQAEMQQALDLSSLLGEAVDAVQTQVTKVLKVRSTQNDEMTVQQFVRYVTLNRLFAEECEAISGRSGQAIRVTLDQQIRDYCSHYGAAQRQQLLDHMDGDKWEARDFTPEYATILDRVVQGASSDSTFWLASSQIWQTLPSALAANGVINGTNEGQKSRSAHIEEQHFVLTTSSIELLQTIDRLQHLTTGIPYLSVDLATTVNDILRNYNSRSLQLILGAGATRTVGLKNITTKHLALSSLGLSFVMALIPYIREFFRRVVPANTAASTLQEFDKTKRMLQEHQTSIHEKLVDIMSAQCAKHVHTFRAIDFAHAAADDPPDKISVPVEALCKETMTLQKVLGKYLDEGAIMSIMIPVFESYERQWKEVIGETILADEAAKARLMRDADYLKMKMDKLNGGSGFGTSVWEAAREKAVVAVASGAVIASGTQE